MTSRPSATVHPFPSNEGAQPDEASHRARLDDASRLAALERSGLMDTPPEDAFDRAVRLATRVLGTPVGLLSLVDGERQFFKAQTGLSGWAADDRQTPLTHSFCQHVVARNAPLAVRDARSDPLVRGNLAVEDLGVIAYLGVPVHAPDGEVLGSFCAIESEPRDWEDAEREALADIAAGIEAEIALRAEVGRTREAEERLRMALHAGQVGTYDFDPILKIGAGDDELHRILGLQRDGGNLFAAVTDLVDPEDQAAWSADLRSALDPNGPGRRDIEVRIRRADTGELRWVHTIGQVSFIDGRAVRVVGTLRDITDRKEAEARERLLTRELNHRVKNLFAVVSGMIGMTARTSETPKSMGTALRSRVQALASAHALIQPAVTGETIESVDVTLQALISTILGPHMRNADVVSLSGPPLTLNTNAASSLALVLHELATNAAKYGALSAPEGRLAIEWGQADDDLIVLWSETGGPPVAGPPERKGFGSTLIDMTVRGQMRGSLRTEWRNEGARYELRLPLQRLH